MSIDQAHLAMISSNGRAKNVSDLDFLAGGGEMGKLVQSMDWSRTPLGPIETWPQSLKTTVSLCLASNFPISLAWGKQFTQIYNDGYWPICGDKHPHSMGQDFRECWAAPWPIIGDAFNRATQGETSYLENQRMFLDRNGYMEETFFTFSFSPIRDESGNIGGLFHPVTEQTSKMLSERRTRALRDLSVRTGKAKSVEEVFRLSAQVLGEYDLDLPFILLYEVTPEGKSFRLAASTGLQPGTLACPNEGELHQCRWPLQEARNTRERSQIESLKSIFGCLSCGPYPEPPKTAFIFPISLPGTEEPSIVFIAGLSARLPLTEGYENFYDLLAITITTSLANAQSYEEERKRAEALAAIDRAKTAFFSNVSHEFRTPLTLMLGPIEDALNDPEPLSEMQRQRLDVAHRNALRLQKLVNSLLDFSRIEAGRIQASYVPTDLSTFTAELASMFRSAIEKAGLELIVHCPPLAEPVYIDQDMWEKIVLNLLSNAFKHTFQGKIEARLSGMADHVELAIQDTGIGIPPDQLPRVFERFHRVPNAQSRTHEGSGIGLALVCELVKLHGGAVDVKSIVDQGTTFTIFIPTGKAHLPADRIEAQSELESTALGAQPFVAEALRWLPGENENNVENKSGSTSSGQSWPGVTHSGIARILLADDNRDMREYICRLLEPYCEVEAVSNGLAAWDAALAHPPDLVLSDIMMPQMDGFALLKAFREDSTLKTIPIILLSARAGEEARVEGLEMGADDYLTKPFNARELMAALKTNLDLHRTRHQETLEILKRKVAERTAQLETVNKELEAFSYSVSHDLRTPLRTIDGFSQAVIDMAQGKLNERETDYLNRVREGSQQMSKLIDAMLNLSRLTRGALTIENNINLSHFAREIADELRRQEPERQVEFDIEEDVIANGDKRLLQVVLQNLLGNSWKYTSQHPKAHICFGKLKNDKTTYYVQDDGAGFDMLYGDKLFGAFQRLHGVHEFEGTGIGLATVARIIHRHGGKIWAEGEVEKGATFYFTLELKTIPEEQN